MVEKIVYCACGDWLGSAILFSSNIFCISSLIQSVEHYQRQSPHINGLLPHSNTCINTFQCARMKYGIRFNLKISTIILQCTKKQLLFTLCFLKIYPVQRVNYCILSNKMEKVKVKMDLQTTCHTTCTLPTQDNQQRNLNSWTRKRAKSYFV